MKVLITGITGFAGQHLYNLLREDDNIVIYGGVRHSSKFKSLLSLCNEAKLLEFDIEDIHSVRRVIEEVHPQIIFHFAGYVSVGNSFNSPIAAFKTNAIGTLNLLEVTRDIVPGAKILIPGSAEEYGEIPQNKMPIKENYPLNPVNPYAISKKFQEEVGLCYFRTYGLNIYLTRTFHYTGPGQPLGFVCSDFAKQVVDIEMGKINSIKVGNLKAKRDFTDIRDVIDAYWKIVDKGKAGEIYNVCSGKSIEIKRILNKLIKFSKKKVLVKVDKNKLRLSDVPDFVGDNKKLKSIGWAPKYTIDDSLNALLQEWRNEVRKR